MLACGSHPDDIAATCHAIGAHTQATVLRVHTKMDLGPAPGSGEDGVVSVSAETGEGLRELLDAIDHAAAVDASAHMPSGAAGDGILITRERHRAGLLAALAELTEFLTVWEQGAVPAPVAAVHLYAARESLTELIGIIDTEDVLDRVFRDFCIGK